MQDSDISAANPSPVGHGRNKGDSRNKGDIPNFQPTEIRNVPFLNSISTDRN
jgi:hypothetical protein